MPSQSHRSNRSGHAAYSNMQRAKRPASVVSDQPDRNVRRREASSDTYLPPRHQDPYTASNLPPDIQEEEETYAKVLALHAPGQNNLAAAYYDPETRKLQVLEDTKNTWGWDLAILLVEQFQPDEIVLSSAGPDALMKLVDEFCVQNPSSKMVLLSQGQFSHSIATYHLAAARLPRDRKPLTQMSWSGSGNDSSETGQEDEEGAGMGKLRLSLLKMGCRVNVDAHHAVGAAGALLSHLARTQTMEQDGDGGFDLDGIESMNLEEYMMINQDALTSIGVFDIESHANMHMQRRKPGLSLNGVINTTVTPLGRKLFHTWLLRPLINIDRINQRLDAVELLSSRDYYLPRKNLRKEMKNVKNFVTFCHKIGGGRASWKDWLGLTESIRAAMCIREGLSVFSLRSSLEVLNKLGAALNEQVQLFFTDILRVIDFDASRDAGSSHVCIRSNIDEEVDEWRETLAGLDSFLSATGQEMGRRVPPNLCDALKVIYLPQLGCLVAIHGLLDESLVPSSWEQQVATDEVVYFKTPEMYQLDDHLGDLENVIMDREIEWVQTLSERLPLVKEGLDAVGEAIAELDCLLSFADAVERLDLRRPVMREEPVLKIRKGFHPLHAMCVSTGQYIDNDTILQGGGKQELAGMMVVTGANGSGKSAYGKQVALITFMAHIGCFVPAQSAEIGICDKIFTRVQTRESSSKSASAFMIDLSQVSQALRGATSRSLLILDEFGKGTTSSDGAGLLAGVVTYLLNGPSPRTVILTHFHELFAQHFLERTLPIIFCHMKSFVTEGTNVLTYLYKLTPTVSLTSNAAECALLHGIPEDVVQRGRVVSDCISKFQITKLIDAQLTKEDLRELASAEELAKMFIGWEPHEDDDDLLDKLREMLLMNVTESQAEEMEEMQPGEGTDGVTDLERCEPPKPEIIDLSED